MRSKLSKVIYALDGGKNGGEMARQSWTKRTNILDKGGRYCPSRHPAFGGNSCLEAIVEREGWKHLQPMADGLILWVKSIKAGCPGVGST